MKRIFNLYTALGFIFLTSLNSCKENSDLLMYQPNDTYIYFGLPFKLNQFNNPLAERVDSMAYTFAFELPTVNKHTFKIPVNISGMSSDKDRPYKIQLIEDGTTATAADYEPIETNQVIRAGRIVDTIAITVIKSPELAKKYKQIVIKLIPGDGFQLGTKEYLTAKLSFTDILGQPKWWTTWQAAFGPYSKEKYQIWINFYKKGIDPTPDIYDKTKPYFYHWDNMPTFTGITTFPILYMYMKQMKDYLIANPTYIDNDPTKARVMIPQIF